MSKIKEQIGELIEKRSLIPDEFWVKSELGTEVVWVLDQEDGTAGIYETSQERIGITKDGKVLWGFSSGCSCWGGWGSGDYCPTMEWKEFQISDFQGTRESTANDWEEKTSKNLQDFLVLTSEDPTPSKVLKLQNAEVRRYMIKRIGYNKIKKAVNAEILHTDGNSELLKFANGEMYVKVKDSSTEREYLLYVEGDHTTCKSAVAWTFGLSEAEYAPIIET